MNETMETVMPGIIHIKNTNKYGVAPKAERTVDGVVFDSKAEAERYGELVMLQAAGKIKDLRRQVTFRLNVNEMLVCKYIADATYVDIEKGVGVVEDTKGVLTPAYRIKKNLMKALYGIDILETGKQRQRRRRK